MEGDDSLPFSTGLEAFDDLWPEENNNDEVDPCIDLDFSPYYLDHEQGNSSVVAESSTLIDNHGTLLQRNYPSIKFNQEISFSSSAVLFEDSFNNNMGFEEGNTSQYNASACTTSGTVILDSNMVMKQDHQKFISKKRKGLLLLKSNVEEGSVLGKKQDHNTKERVRRMELKACYRALGSLLPLSKTSKINDKKRWTAPVIVDKAIDHIPQLEDEIKQLTLKKNNILSIVQNMSSLIIRNKKMSTGSEVNTFTISVNEVKNGELIIQICRQRSDGEISSFSRLLQNIEDEGLCLVSASTLHVCDDRDCYHIHIQIMNIESSSSTNEGDYYLVLKEKMISWL